MLFLDPLKNRNCPSRHWHPSFHEMLKFDDGTQPISDKGTSVTMYYRGSAALQVVQFSLIPLQFRPLPP